MTAPRRATRLASLSARTRIPLLLVGVAAAVVARFTGLLWLGVTGVALLLVGAAFYVRLGLVRDEPVTVACPVRGRWRAVNSPANRVPSHGIQAYGQAYAVDLVHEPEIGERPGFGWWPLVRRPREFPGFGQPVFAAADGVVLRAHDRQRDHWSRNSWPALLYMLVEGVREFFGAGGILGNHVVVDCGDGVYAAYAHLQRRSVAVRKGERVHVGQQIGSCGNSGNSSEPHVHFQLMDHPNLMFAAGLPVSFEQFEVEGERCSGLPRNGLFSAEPAIGELRP